MQLPRIILKKIFVCLKVIIVTLLFSQVAKSEWPLPLQLEEQKQSVSVTEGAQYLRDPSGNMSLSDIINSPKTSSWLNLMPQKTNLGWSDDVFWMRMRVRNQSETKEKYYLTFSFTRIDQIDLYFANSGGQYSHLKTGLNFPFSEWPVKHNHLSFPLEIPKKAEAILFLRIKNSSVINVDANIISSAVLAESQSKSRDLFVAFSSFIVLAIILAGVFFLAFKDYQYLWFLVYIFVFAMYAFVMENMDVQYFISSISHTSGLKTFYGACAISVFLPFIKRYLEIDSSSRILFYTIIITRIVVIFMMILPFLNTGSWVDVLSAQIGTLFFLVCLIILMVNFKKSSAAKLLFYGFSAHLLLMSVYIQSAIGNFSSFSWVPFLPFMAVISQVAPIFLGVLSKILSINEALALGNSKLSAVNEVLHREIVLREELSLRLINSEKHAAIARTVQMLAHDVRKPFSLLKAGLKEVETIDSLVAVQEFNKIFLPEVEQALASVSGLLDDVMEIDRKVAFKKMPVSIQSVISKTLREIFVDKAKTEITFQYKLCNIHMLDVEEGKIIRVFSNIVSNAVQAIMNNTGDKIWFCSENVKADGKEFIRIVIGNNGPPISKENLIKLFDVFFTENKNNGTGLGLPIAKKIVCAHGGELCCESDVESKTTEFIFTLPVETYTLNDAASVVLEILPDSLINIKPLFGKLLNHNKTNLAKSAQNKPKVVIVDDSVVFCTMWESACSDAEVIAFNSPSEFLAKIGEDKNWLNSLAIVVIDQNFGRFSSHSGLELAAKLRSDFGFVKPILLSSNGVFAESELTGKVDLVITKNGLTFAKCLELLQINSNQKLK